MKVSAPTSVTGVSGSLVRVAHDDVQNLSKTVVAEGTVVVETATQSRTVVGPADFVNAIELTAQGNISGSDGIVWSRQDAAPYVASPVLYKDLIYFTKSREGILYSAEAKSGKTVLDQELSFETREQYRRLAATLYHAQEHSGTKVVMITSAVAGEGKTLTATNLALTLSESYHLRVLLIDADLRRPTWLRMRYG